MGHVVLGTVCASTVRSLQLGRHGTTSPSSDVICADISSAKSSAFRSRVAARKCVPFPELIDRLWVFGCRQCSELSRIPSFAFTNGENYCRGSSTWPSSPGRPTPSISKG